MEAFILDWLSLFFRWFHVIAGIAWIGASFYFIWLDLSLTTPPEWKKKKGIKGDLWAIHGGGIYEVAKYECEPEAMPAKLHWFKWEAYTTWITGFILLTIMYYWGAHQYLIDPDKLALTQLQAILLSLACIFSGFIIYELLIKSPIQHSPKIFALCIFSILVVYAYFLNEVFTGRAAYLHVGAIIGTIMAANVLFGIMPAQRELVRAIEAGEKPDPKPALLAKLRSTHNNYFTLPLIFIMISNHYPMTYGHENSWLILVMISLNAAFVRHYFNLKHQGKHQPWILVLGSIFLLLIIGYMIPKPVADTSDVLSDNEVLEITRLRCTSCHAQDPTQTGIVAPPSGVVLESLDHLKQNRNRVLQAIQTNYMPLANITKMTNEERQNMMNWLRHTE